MFIANTEEGRGMMKCLLPIAIGAGLLAPVVCTAQLATPQWRQPAIDSTHVVGTAVRVMPEFPPTSSEGQYDELPTVKTPQTISELLAAFDGVILAMPGNERQGAHGQIRLAITAEKAQVQSTISWNWADVCAATAPSPSCSLGAYRFTLSPEGVFVFLIGCDTGWGSAGGTAEFKWTDFVALGGLSGATKQWVLQRDNFWSNCRIDAPNG